jgi:D-serine deaminase-like pyridoxal phosphate-dependent protein
MRTIYDLETPALLVDLDVLEKNIERMAWLALTNGKTLRPHIKTHKTPEIAKMQLRAGAVGLTVAKLGEAESLAAAGCHDLFIANEIVGAVKLVRLLHLMERAKVTVGVDSADVALPIAHAAHDRGLRVPMCIEVDTGLDRAGTRTPEEALQLARIISAESGAEFVGIFTHEGHLYRAADPQTRNESALNVVKQMTDLSAALEAQGTPARSVSVGSTPGAPLMARLQGPTELRPGVYVFNDRTQQTMGCAKEACALTVLSTVVSVRSNGRVILDAGSKSLASDRIAGDGLCGEIVGRPDLALIGMSEEHGHVQADGSTGVRVGDKLRIVPNHACTCVNQHDAMSPHRGEAVETSWQITARGKIR